MIRQNEFGSFHSSCLAWMSKGVQSLSSFQKTNNKVFFYKNIKVSDGLHPQKLKQSN